MQAPPRPERRPESITAIYLILWTFIPAEATADGCSPQALSLRPKLVLYRRNQEKPQIARQSQVVQYVSEKNNGPMTGIFDKRGMSILTIPLFAVILPDPVIVFAKKSDKAVASIFIAVPDIVWSAFKLIAATACKRESNRDATIATMIPITIARFILNPGIF